MPWRNPARALFLAMVVNLLLVLTGGYFTITNLSSNCDRRIEAREDTRLMWIELFDMFPESAEGQRLRVILDQRLPSLRCDWWSATPIGED